MCGERQDTHTHTQMEKRKKKTHISSNTSSRTIGESQKSLFQLGTPLSAPTFGLELQSVGTPDSRVSVGGVGGGREDGALFEEASADHGTTLGHHARETDRHGRPEPEGLVDDALGEGEVLAIFKHGHEAWSGQRARERRVEFPLERPECGGIAAEHVDQVCYRVARRVGPRDELGERFGFDLEVGEVAARVRVFGGEEIVQDVAAGGISRGQFAFLHLGDANGSEVFGRLKTFGEEAVKDKVWCPC